MGARNTRYLGIASEIRRANNMGKNKNIEKNTAISLVLSMGLIPKKKREKNIITPGITIR